MSTSVQVALDHIKQVAESGLKHAHGGVFPIDSMEQCFKLIIEIVEKQHGNKKSA